MGYHSTSRHPTAQQQPQRINLDKTMFWHCTLQLNENGPHTFFDVKSVRSVPCGSGYMGLFTSDIPPFQLNATDRLKCSIILESMAGLTCDRKQICDCQLSGAEVEKVIGEPGPKTHQDQLLVTTDTGEWQFQRVKSNWYLRSVTCFVAVTILKQFVKDL